MLIEVFDPQSYKFTFVALVPLLSAIFVISLGIFVLQKNIKSKINLLFMMFCLSTSSWFFGTFMMFMVQKDELAISWDRFIYMGVVFMPVTMHHFSIIFARVKGQGKILLWNYILAILFLIISRTDYFVAGLYKYKFGCYAIAQPVHHLFLLYFWGGVVLLNLNIYKYYRATASSIEKSKSKYVLLAVLVLFFIGGIGYLPAYRVPIYPFPFLSGLVFTIFLAISIIKYKLMEIDTVIHRTILWVLTTLILIIPIGIIHSLLRIWMFQLPPVWIIIIDTIVLLVFVGAYQRIKPRIDHLFRRRKYDYYAVLEELGQKIGSELELEKIGNRIFKELKDILYIRNGVLLVQEPGQEDYQESGSIGYEGDSNLSKHFPLIITFQQ